MNWRNAFLRSSEKKDGRTKTTCRVRNDFKKHKDGFGSMDSADGMNCWALQRPRLNKRETSKLTDVHRFWHRFWHRWTKFLWSEATVQLMEKQMALIAMIALEPLTVPGLLRGWFWRLSRLMFSLNMPQNSSNIHLTHLPRPISYNSTKSHKNSTKSHKIP